MNYNLGFFSNLFGTCKHALIIFKKNFKEDIAGLAFINKLKPVSYTLDIEGIEAKLLHKPIAFNSDDRRAAADKEKIMYNGFIVKIFLQKQVLFFMKIF